MIFVNKNCNIDLNNIILKLPPTDKRVTRCINRLVSYNNNDYKYGNSWIDKWIRNYNIRKINILLKRYSIIVT